MVSRRKKQQKIRRHPRNPVDVRAGIRDEDIGMSRAAQRTPTKKEIETFQRTGRSTAQQERIRATKRADPSSAGDVQRAVDARNKERGFPSGDVPLRAPVEQTEQTPSLPVETGEVQPTETPVLEVQPVEELVPTEQQQIGEEINVGLDPTLVNTEILNLDIVGVQNEARNPNPDLAQVAGLTAAGVGISFGGAALLAVSSVGSAILASGGLSTRAIASAASGKLTTNIGGIAVNPVTAVKVAKYLSGLVKATTSPLAVMGILGTGLYTSLFWAQNEKGDAMTSLTIGQKEALKNGDYESVLEIGIAIQEANNISAGVPIVGFTQAEKAKFEASVQISEVYVQEAKKKAAEGAEGTPVTPKELPKWTETEQGKFQPNENNPFWIKEGGRNVWTGR